MNTAVLLAAGSGTRMAGAVADKVLAPLACGASPLALCLRAFVGSGCIDKYVIVTRDDEQRRAIAEIAKEEGVAVTFVQGGAQRADSVCAALDTIPYDHLVFIHDAARPLIRPGDILALEKAARENGAAALARPVTDTIKRLGQDVIGRPILEDLDRSSLRAMETPQVFRTGQILRSYHAAQMHGLCPTDDAAAGAVLGLLPVLVEASGPNPKITTSHDLNLVNFLMSPDPASFRIGHGYDIHRFAEGRRMVLGGVEIPHPRGLDGHSDADCVCHALADAILGAAGLPDIGHYFPPGKPEFKDIDSILIVREAVRLARENGLRVGNADITIIAREPKVSPHVAAMKERLAEALCTSTAKVAVKATTNEGLDALGRGEGIAAHAVVLMTSHGCN